MLTRKIIAIGARSNLTEVTIFDSNEVVEYLKQRDWYLPSESFIKIAPDEYCLVDNLAIMPGMDVVDEQRTRERIAAKTAGLKELQKRKRHAAIMSMIPAVGIAMVLAYLMLSTTESWDHMTTKESVLTFVMAFFAFFPFVGIGVLAVIDLKGGCHD